MAFEKSIIYFSEPGEGNTDRTLEAAKTRAEELGIKNIIVASTRGGTGVKAVEVFKGYNVVVVTHSTGFRGPGKQELEEAKAEKIRSGGGRILTTGHAFSGVSRAIRRKFDTVGPAEVVAQTLRLFGQGMKVCVECAAMAADAGLIPADKDIIAIAGSGRGADTAVVIKPANSSRLFELVVREIIAKPSSL
jgi:hypothetical protein